MLKRIIIIVFVIISICIVSISSYAKDIECLINNEQFVRVAISDNNFKTLKYQEIIISATNDYEVYEKNENKFILGLKKETPLKIVMKNGFFDFYVEEEMIQNMISGPLEIRVKKDGRLKVVDLKRKNKQAEYRGFFEIRKVKNDMTFFNLINHVTLQEYLYGVVPNEMPINFGLEALKAQSIAARNYVLRPIAKKNEAYDVCDTVSSQVYYGFGTETPLSNQAVDETEDLVAMYDGNLILALYSSTAGGYTENYENAFHKAGTKIFPANPLPYLKGVPDIENAPSLETEEMARIFYTSKPETFDNGSPYFRWEREWSKDELQQIFKVYIEKNKNNGFITKLFNKEDDFGELLDIKIKKRGVSGKIVSLVIVGDKNAYEIEKELVIRRLFIKNNIALPSANFILDFINDEEGNIISIKAYGGGFGHGVGMSQFGAGYLSRCGKTFSDILKHYYSGIFISTIPEEISNNEGENYIVRSFFLQKPYASLVLENLKNNDEFFIDINGNKLKLNPYDKPKQKTVYNLDKFLKVGKNSIIYYYKNNSNNQKKIKVYIELREKESEKAKNNE